MIKNNYDSSNIQVLKGLDAVKKRPGMYIGDTQDGSGLHHMVFEVLDNSIDESLSGFCDCIQVVLEEDNAISIIDNGRGIPTDIHKEEGKSAAEVILTVLHAGGKFDNNSYNVSGGLHGVGLSVVNALSEYLELTIWKDGYEYYQRYNYGCPENKLLVIRKTDKTGTKILFKPDKNIFSSVIFDYNILLKRVRELSFLNAGVKISLFNRLIDKYESFQYNGGINSFVQFLNKNKQILHNTLININGHRSNVYVELSMQWNSSYQENIYCYTNNIYQKDGGSHLSGLKSSLTRSINNYIDNELKNKKYKINVSGDDVREGLTAVLSLKMLDPKFSSQTKNKLISYEIRTIVEQLVNEKFYDFLLEHPDDVKKIINKIIESAKVRDAAKKARDITRKKNLFDITTLPGKLASCQEKNPMYSELYIVEGDSAGGSAKQARDRKVQAILPLKGKILNVEKSSLDKILTSQEIATLVKVLGCGIGKDDYNYKKVRYHKIILMTDADIDGSHIRTLLLTFFYRYMPELIMQGYIYIAQPPLYSIKNKNKYLYFKNDDELLNYLDTKIISNVSLYSEVNNNVLDNINFKVVFNMYKNFMNILDKLRNTYSQELLQMIAYFNKDYNKNFHEWLSEFIRFANSQTIKFSHYSYNDNDNDSDQKILGKTCQIIHHVNGVNINYHFSEKFFFSDDYNSIKKYGNVIQNLINNKISIMFNKQHIKITNFENCMTFILNNIKKLYKIQRYKGLGEMNPNQLWDTTMNPNNRNMLKVNITDNIVVDEMVSVLMGDNVFLRRNFIETNSLNVLNLDI